MRTFTRFLAALVFASVAAVGIVACGPPEGYCDALIAHQYASIEEIVAMSGQDEQTILEMQIQLGYDVQNYLKTCQPNAFDN